MPGSKAVSLLEELLVPALEKIKVEIVELEYRRENHQQMLRVFIDSDHGVDLELCTRCSRLIKGIIDDHNDIPYDNIEVSSPGLDRIIKNDKDFLRFQGQRIKVRTTESFDNCKKFSGILKDTNSEYLKIEADDRIISLPRASIAVVRLYPEF